MLPLFLCALSAYQFQKLDFIPIDINDKGQIVGETRNPQEHGWKTSAVLLVDGKLRELGSYAGTGSAFAINNKGHILIKCEMSALPKAIASTKPRWNTGSPFFFWSNDKASFLGFFAHTPRLMDSDRFIQSDSLVSIKNNKANVKNLPPLPSRNSENPRSHTTYFDMNEAGMLVGLCDFGYYTDHAVTVDRKGRMTDIFPEVEIHTSWGARLVNARGTVLGYHTYDMSIGGGAFYLWNKGKPSDLSGFEVNRPSASAVSLNDHDEVVGNLWLSGSGAYLQEMANREYNEPHIATATSQAILWKDGKILNLNDLADLPKGTVLTSADKINNKGWIIGTAVAEGKRFGYLLKPTGQ